VSNLSSEHVRIRLLELTAYLASAAHGNVGEPSSYGPYRLLEGAVRVLRTIDELGLGDDELRSEGEGIVDHAMRIVKDQAIARERAEQLLNLALDRLEATDATAG
jgi:uncharacterized protein DUF6092